MTDTDVPATAVASSSSPTPLPAATSEENLECHEAEFVVCCFALCLPDSYDIQDGTLQIRGQA